MNIKNFINKIIENKLYSLYIMIIMLIPFLFTPFNFHWIIVGLIFFSIVLNNSFQILGTFLIINKNTSIWKSWLFLSSIFVITIMSCWFLCKGQIHFKKLNTIAYTENLTFFHYISPLVIIYFTKKKIPASASFLFLSLFASKSGIYALLANTFRSYIISFIGAFFIWKYLGKIIKKLWSNKINFEELEKNQNLWVVLQYVSTASLWISWLISNSPTAIVFLPRQFDFKSLSVFLFLGCFIIYYILYKKGGAMQNIIKNKKDTDNLQSATMLNIIYSLMIYTLQFAISMPISTTWVFVGLMGGRELAIIENKQNIISNISFKNSIQKILKDLLISSIGILISFIFVQISFLFR